MAAQNNETMNEALLDQVVDSDDRPDTSTEAPSSRRNSDEFRSLDRIALAYHRRELEIASSSWSIPWKRISALFFIALAVATWVTEIEVTKSVLSGVDPYNNPYMLVWMAHNFSMVLGFLMGGITACMIPKSEGRQSLTNMVFRPQGTFLWSSFWLSVLCNLCTWLWFASIPLTDDVVNTVIYQSCCVWCFIISVVILGEKVTVIKVLATICTFSGVAVISSWPCVAKSAAQQVVLGENLWGDTLCLCSAICYALYEVLLKMLGSQANEEEVAHEDESVYGHMSYVPLQDSLEGLRSASSLGFMVGWMGLWNLTLLWAPAAILHFSGYTTFVLPHEDVLPYLLLDCFLEGAYLVWLAIAIALSSPLFVTIGTVLAIPASAAADTFLHGITCPLLSFVGGGLVLLGFVGINITFLVEGRRGWPSWL